MYGEFVVKVVDVLEERDVYVVCDKFCLCLYWSSKFMFVVGDCCWLIGSVVDYGI